MTNLTKGWVRLLVAASVFWILIVAGIIFAEYLSQKPELYFWTWPRPDPLDPFAPTPRPEPNLLRIVAILFGPLPIFWVAGWLIVWVMRGFKSRE